MTDPNIPPEHATPRKGAGAGLAFIVGGLLVAVAVIAWLVFAGVRPPTPETPHLNLDIHVPAPRMPQVPDRPTPRELPSPAEPPTVSAPAPAQAVEG